MTLKKIRQFATFSTCTILLISCKSSDDSLSDTTASTSSIASTSTAVATTVTTSTPVTTVAPYTDSEYELAKAQMRTEIDTVENLTWIYDKTSPTSWANSFYLYIGTQQGEDPWFRFVVSYYGSDWIFFTKETINVDGKIFTINHEYFDMKHDNSGGGVYEWIDVQPSKADISMLQLIAKSESTVVRLQGDTYKKDIEITAKQKTAIQNVLTVYEGLTRGKIDLL